MWSSHTISASGFGPPPPPPPGQNPLADMVAGGPNPIVDLVRFRGFGPPTYIQQCQTRTLFGKEKLAQFQLESQQFYVAGQILFSARCPGQCRNSFSWEQNQKYDRGRQKSYECIKWKLPSVIWTFFGNQLKCIGFYQWLECQTLFPPGGSNPQRGDQIC